MRSLLSLGQRDLPGRVQGPLPSDDDCPRHGPPMRTASEVGRAHRACRGSPEPCGAVKRAARRAPRSAVPLPVTTRRGARSLGRRGRRLQCLVTIGQERRQRLWIDGTVRIALVPAFGGLTHHVESIRRAELSELESGRGGPVLGDAIASSCAVRGVVGEFCDHLLGGGKVDAGVGDALPVRELGLVAAQFLFAAHEIALDHDA